MPTAGCLEQTEVWYDEGWHRCICCRHENAGRILGHNDDVITEKFKDIFPDPNIEAALIAMDDFVAMQTKAKQLVQIYKPAHDSPMASAAILVCTAGNTPTSAGPY